MTDYASLQPQFAAVTLRPRSIQRASGLEPADRNSVNEGIFSTLPGSPKGAVHFSKNVGRQLKPHACGSPERLMWITPDRLFCIGMLGVPAVRTMGSVIVYVAVEGSIEVSIDGQGWRQGEMAIVPPYVSHQVRSQGQLINMIKLEAETVDTATLPHPLRGSGVVDAHWFADRVRQCGRELCAKDRDVDLMALDFDQFFFDGTPATRAVDRRILAVMDFIKRQPSAPASAEDCAAIANLSFSRFLHLFKQEIGVPFRGFRTWKRARSLLHYVNKDSNLANIAQETGYADSTHFSHSIKQVYGQKPKEIFAGWRGIAVHANTLC